MTQPVLLALLAMRRHNWEQGVASQAMLDIGRADLARLMAHSAVTLQAADGRLGGDDDNAVNGAACGEAVLAAARYAAGRGGLDAAGRGGADAAGRGGADAAGRGGADAAGRGGADAEHGWFREAAGRQLEWLLRGAPRAADGTIYHVLGGEEVWADTVYMVVPFLALAGHPDEAVRQVDGHRARLCRDGLYSAVAGRRPEHWGGGNGWVVAGIARAVRLCPQLKSTHLPAHAREVLDACLRFVRADGLFHDVVDDPATFRETNTGQMLAYAAFTGVADGWLPPLYADRARELLAAATREIDENGLVRNACGAPHFDRAGTSPEAQAFHLLAVAASTDRRTSAVDSAGG